VHDAARQRIEQGAGGSVEAIDQDAHDRIELGIAHRVTMPVDHVARVRQVPVELAVSGPVVEAGERGIELAGRASPILVQTGRPPAHGSERPPGQMRERPDPMPAAVPALHPVQQRAARRRHRPRRERRSGRQMRQRGLLRLEHARVLLGVRNLEHDAGLLGGRGGDQKILIALAWQRCRRARQAEQLGRQALGVGALEPRARVEHRG